ncbi:DUF6199 family natural product biosynthesis protein [Paenibacillus turpanensis]|uniref:DUF6199 family natural product biosynthesis protein n=1 Tax=Paenibacillus turpanensis TaxID=2689078 RepID=UPI0014080D06|nr:DUF6199 family natural product biosynthesis protein [Paenibacillus turpanensis]
MLWMGIFLTVFGLVMLLRTELFWKLTASWMSYDFTEPSGLYLWNTRIGGVIVTVVGLASIVADLML